MTKIVKTLKFVAILFLLFFLAAVTAWVALAIFYSNIINMGMRIIIAVGFVTCTVLAFIVQKNRVRTGIMFMVVVYLIIIWWLNIPPSNNRNWQPDVAVLPYAVIQDNIITIYNIRNVNYRTETDFDVNYYDKTFDLNKLTSVDLIAVYWMGDAIAHIMVSFGFQEKDYVAFSIETRKEIGEAYSNTKGFFKQYELIYVVADERDLIRVRTDFRNPREDVYLFRTAVSREKQQRLFMEYIKQINTLKKKPAWYNSLTTNCTTNIVMHIKTFSDRIHYSWKILLSGYIPLYAYEHGVLDNRISFSKLKKQSYINGKAYTIDNDPEFSKKIRDELPIPVK